MLLKHGLFLCAWGFEKFTKGFRRFSLTTFSFGSRLVFALVLFELVKEIAKGTLAHFKQIRTRLST
jgi:hypothetical protein